MAAFISPKTLIARNGSTNALTVREVSVLRLGPLDWVITYDSAAIASNWSVWMASTADGGRIIGTRTQQTLSGSPTGNVNCVGPIVKDGSNYVWYLLNAFAYSTNIPQDPYSGIIFQCTVANLKNNLWTYIRQTPPLGGAGTFNEDTNVVGSVLTVGGTINFELSTRTVDSSANPAWTNGHSTSVTLSGVQTMDGSGPDDAFAINNNSGTGTRVENPRPFASTQLATGGNAVTWGKINNTIDPTGSIANGSVVYFVGGDPNIYPTWRGVLSYSQIIIANYAAPITPNQTWPTVGAFNAPGIISPFTNPDGTIWQETNGSIGFAMDGNNSSVSVHEDRDGFQGQLEPLAGAAQITDPSPGQGVQAYWASTTLTNADFICEFMSSGAANSTTTNADIALIYRFNGLNNDATAVGYCMDFSYEQSGAVAQLFNMNSGFTPVGSSTGICLPLDLDSRNFRGVWHRAEIVGNVHKGEVNGVQVINATDGGSTHASGTSVGLRSVGLVGRVRDARFYKSANVVINGLNNGDTVSLRGAGGVIFDTQTASGTSVTLTSHHYYMLSIDVNGTQHYPSDGGLIWGGDVYLLQFPIVEVQSARNTKYIGWYH